MTYFEKAHVDIPPAKHSDQRVGHLIGMHLRETDQADAVLLGFPFDKGVALNDGRVGAAEAPDLIRSALFGFTPPTDGGNKKSLVGRIRDLGNLTARETIDQSQSFLAQAIAPWLKQGIPVIILGGGHETAFGHFLGYVHCGLDVKILNWDAHVDVRELKEGRGHSGSSFRQALSHASGLCQGYTVAGLLRHMNAGEHLDYLRKMGGHAYWREDLSAQLIRKIYSHLNGRTLVTFDMDAVDQAYAPGVSSPATAGLSQDLWLLAARLAGESHEVSSIDISEVNPRYDRDNQTVRLAGLTIWNFLIGLTKRKLGEPHLLQNDQEYPASNAPQDKSSRS